jgi:hypothetical protein
VTGELDERQYLHVFLLKWGTAGKLARFIIDGRKYDSSDAVRADIEEAAAAMARLHIPAEMEMRRIGPNDQGPTLPSWREFREGLAAMDIEQASWE